MIVQNTSDLENGHHIDFTHGIAATVLSKQGFKISNLSYNIMFTLQIQAGIPLYTVPSKQS